METDWCLVCEKQLVLQSDMVYCSEECRLNGCANEEGESEREDGNWYGEEADWRRVESKIDGWAANIPAGCPAGAPTHAEFFNNLNGRSLVPKLLLQLPRPKQPTLSLSFSVPSSSPSPSRLSSWPLPTPPARPADSHPITPATESEIATPPQGSEPPALSIRLGTLTESVSSWIRSSKPVPRLSSENYLMPSEKVYYPVLPAHPSAFKLRR